MKKKFKASADPAPQNKKIRLKGRTLWRMRDGKYHRADGPAVERDNGDREWYVNGVRHRADGPAIDYANGHQAWYLDGKRLSEDEFNGHLRREKKKQLEAAHETIKKAIRDGLSEDMPIRAPVKIRKKR